MTDDIWAEVDNARKPNRKERRAAEKQVDRSLRIGVFKRGGTHRHKGFRGRVKDS